MVLVFFLKTSAWPEEKPIFRSEFERKGTVPLSKTTILDVFQQQPKKFVIYHISIPFCVSYYILKYEKLLIFELAMNLRFSY